MNNSFKYFLTKNKSIYLLPLLIICLIMNGCNSTDNDDSGKIKKSLIPLTNSNSWSFVSKSGDMEAKIKIGTKATINNHKAYKVLGNAGISTFYVRKDDSGIYLGKGEPYAEFLLKYPIDDGSTYEYTDQVNNEYKITANKKSVSVPAGDFSCLNYKIIFDVYQEEEIRTINVCITPDIGPIRYSETASSPYESNRELLLSSYNLN